VSAGAPGESADLSRNKFYEMPDFSAPASLGLTGQSSLCQTVAGVRQKLGRENSRRKAVGVAEEVAVRSGSGRGVREVRGPLVMSHGVWGVRSRLGRERLAQLCEPSLESGGRIALEGDGLGIVVDASGNQSHILDALCGQPALADGGFPQLFFPEHVAHKVAEAVDDPASTITLDAAEDVRVMSDDQVDACIDERVRQLNVGG
jgi:hypothetical protein